MTSARRLACVLGMVATLGLAALGCRSEGPEAIVWDQEACAECHMQISDRHYGAQLQTESGETLNFDDPGCLLAYVGEHPATGARLWFRHHKRDLWLPGTAVHFVPVGATPMGYGLGAVGAGWKPAMAMVEAKRHVAERVAARRAGP